MTRHVLKNNQVQLAGSRQLHIDAGLGTESTKPQHDSKPARIRIAETDAEFALLEVTCSCGQVTLVRCEYATANTPAMAAGSVQG